MSTHDIPASPPNDETAQAVQDRLHQELLLQQSSTGAANNATSPKDPKDMARCAVQFAHELQQFTVEQQLRIVGALCIIMGITLPQHFCCDRRA